MTSQCLSIVRLLDRLWLMPTTVPTRQPHDV